MAQLALDEDGPAVPVGDAVHHRQAEAGALSRRLGGEERLEDPLDRRRCHAVAGVLDREADVRTRPQFPVAVDHGLIDDPGLEPDVDPSRLAVHRLPGVGGQVDDHLVHLRGVGQDVGQVRLDVVRQLDAGGNHRAEQVGGFEHHRPELDGLLLVRLRTAEGEDALDQVGGAMHRARRISPRFS